MNLMRQEDSLPIKKSTTVQVSLKRAAALITGVILEDSTLHLRQHTVQHHAAKEAITGAIRMNSGIWSKLFMLMELKLLWRCILRMKNHI